MRRLAIGALLALVSLQVLAGRPLHAAPPSTASFAVGAANVDITPPPYTTASDALFVPACAPTPELVQMLWPGPRVFAFEKPYVDVLKIGRYAPGDPYCDADHSGRYEAPYLAGGHGSNRWPLTVDPGNPVMASVMVLALGQTRIALVSVDSIGIFNVTMDAIRAQAKRFAPGVQQVFVSSTHDESAPDPIGLWGPDASDLPGSVSTPSALSSGVDEYYMSFLAERVGSAVGTANNAARPAKLRLAVAHQPSNVQSCFSSYPYIEDELLPIMQAVDAGTGKVIVTMLNGNTHVETLAFSNSHDYQTRLSGDWVGPLRADFAARWPGSVGMEMTGLVGSVETPTVYQPESTQVIDVPGPHHDSPGNPDGCSTVYPEPATGTPAADAVQFNTAYAQTLADTVATTLATRATTVVPTTLRGQQQSLCTQLENNFFVAALGAGLFPDRPAYADPTCSVGSSTSTAVAPAYHLPPGGIYPPTTVWLKTDVAVVTVGPAQIAYSPGEVFPFSEIRGAIDQSQMPFPTDCYNPNTNDFSCGAPLPMTPWTAAGMTTRFRFQAGLGQDMIGYLFPPGNFVGDQGETGENPWAAYELSKGGGNDRFGHHHSDDAESPGPHVGLAVTQALASLLAAGGHGNRVLPGLFVDATSHLSDSPFADASFGGAVGMVVVDSTGQRVTYRIGSNAAGYATFDGMPDAGTAGTSLPYSVNTGGLVLRGGGVLLVDVYAGAHLLLGA
jgi:hypothetical protein